MKKIFIVCAAAFCTQAAIAGDGLGVQDSVTSPLATTATVRLPGLAQPSVAVAPTVTAPVQLTDAEMDKVVGGLMFLFHGIPSGQNFDLKVLPNSGGNSGSNANQGKGANRTVL